MIFLNVIVLPLSCLSKSLLFMLIFREFYGSEWYYVTWAYNTLSLTALWNFLRWSKKSYLMIILYKNNIYIMKLQSLFFKEEMFPPKDKVQGLSKVIRSKFDKNTCIWFFCKTFYIFSIFTSTFILNYHFKYISVCSYMFKQIFIIYFILLDVYGSEW